jgi:acyl-CoA thioesterase-1
VTDQVNTVIKAAAAQSGSAYVDLRAAFKGPDYEFDETHYLSNDGDCQRQPKIDPLAASEI